MPIWNSHNNEVVAVSGRGASPSYRARSRSGVSGVTLLEMLIVLAILAVVIGIALPSYSEHLKRTDILQATTDIGHITNEIHDYFLDRNQYPASLNDIRLHDLEDPWGNPYEYFRIEGGTHKGKGKLRKDKNLVPINSDYDLYSKGPDGRSVSPLTAKHSRDDIIRANNGGFIGIAKDY